jgi:hypothetical protein
LKLAVKITLPLIPSHQGRGNYWLPLPLWERVGVRGGFRLFCKWCAILFEAFEVHFNKDMEEKHHAETRQDFSSHSAHLINTNA